MFYEFIYEFGCNKVPDDAKWLSNLQVSKEFQHPAGIEPSCLTHCN